MADTLDVLTLQEAEAAINMVGNSANHAAELELWITAVSRRLDALTGPVVQRSVTETLTASGPVITPRLRPVSSVTSVTEYVGGTGTVLTAATTTAAGTYRLRDNVIERRSGFYGWSFNGEVTIVYVAGRAASTATVDERFKTVAGMTLRRLWAREGAAWSRGGDVFAGDTGPGFFRAIDPMIEEFLGDELLPPAVA